VYALFKHEDAAGPDGSGTPPGRESSHMRKIGLVVAAVAGIAFAGAARAQVTLDLKVGYAIPTGNGGAAAPMSDTWGGAIPLGIDALYRFTPNLSAGVFFQWNPAFAASGFCAREFGATATCSGSDMRVGILVAYAFLPQGSFNPWVSLGTGWEWTNMSAKLPGGTAGATFSGWEYLNLQAGVDFPLARIFAIGPYIGYSGGTFTSMTGTGNNSGMGTVTIESANRAFHGWLQFGVKGTLNL